jgi:hypothetical protein
MSGSYEPTLISQELNKSNNKLNNIIFIFFLVIATLMILYGMYIMYIAQYSEYYHVVAIIKEIDCNNFAVNNHSNEYHCVVSVEYYAHTDLDNLEQIEQYNTSLIFIDNELFEKGDKVQVMVNINNPLDVKIQAMSDQVFSIIISVIASLLIIVAFAIRYVKIE